MVNYMEVSVGKIDTAVILAAGLGTRLRPLTSQIAKPAIQFFNKALICHIIHRLADCGIRRLFINLHYNGWSVRRAIRKHSPKDLHIIYSHEPTILGTAGALGPLKTRLRSGPFLLINGDVLTDLSFPELIERHLNTDNVIATVTLHPPSIQSGFPPVGSSSTNRLSRFPYGPLTNGEADWEGTFAGIHAINPQLLDYIADDGYQCINSRIYPRALEDGHSIATFRHEGYWNDIGTPARLFSAYMDVFREKLVIPDFTVARDKPRWISPEAKIARDVKLSEPIVICSGATIQRGAELQNAIVLPGARVSAQTQFTGGFILPKQTYLSLQRRKEPCD